jgi:hypothetical protein
MEFSDITFHTLQRQDGTWYVEARNKVGQTAIVDTFPSDVDAENWIMAKGDDYRRRWIGIDR